MEENFFRYKNEDVARLLLRLTLGGLMIFHGFHKLFNGVSFIEGLFIDRGLPAFMAYGAYLGEVIAPLMLILGFRVKIASLLIVMTMLVAIALVHMGDIFSLTKHGAWGIELQMFYIMAAVSVFLQGNDKYSLDNYFAGKARQ